MMGSASGKVRVLVVDDDLVDIRAARKLLTIAGVGNEVEAVQDAEMALSLLKQHVRNDNATWIVLLDLNMPRLDGIGFLKRLREDQELRRTVVFVVTSSSSIEDRNKAFDYNVAGYLVKSCQSEAIERQAALLKSYLSEVQFPKVTPLH